MEGASKCKKLNKTGNMIPSFTEFLCLTSKLYRWLSITRFYYGCIEYSPISFNSTECLPVSKAFDRSRTLFWGLGGDISVPSWQVSPGLVAVSFFNIVFTWSQWPKTNLVWFPDKPLNLVPWAIMRRAGVAIFVDGGPLIASFCQLEGVEQFAHFIVSYAAWSSNKIPTRPSRVVKLYNYLTVAQNLVAIGCQSSTLSTIK